MVKPADSQKGPRKRKPDLYSLLDQVDEQPPAAFVGGFAELLPRPKVALPSTAPAPEPPPTKNELADPGEVPVETSSRKDRARAALDTASLFTVHSTVDDTPGPEKAAASFADLLPRPKLAQTATPPAPEPPAMGEAATNKRIIVTPPRKARARASLDTATLFEEPAKTTKAAQDFANLLPRQLAKQPPVEAPEAASTPASQRRGLVRGKADLSGLLEEADRQVRTQAGRAHPDEKPGFDDLLPAAVRRRDQAGEVQLAEEAEGELLAIPPELQTYIPPDLWRRLNGPTPARGVLINVLERVRSILYLLSTALPRHLVQEKMRRPYAQVKGQMMDGALLFSDVSGFTALSERLQEFGQEGAERLTMVMNRYFSAMLDILASSDGILLKFAGDATLAYFPAQEDGEHVHAAVRAGRRMLRKMADFAQVETPAGTVALRMKIGMAAGPYLAASVGDGQRMEYIVLGPAVTQTMGAEGATTGGGQLVVNAAAAGMLDGIARKVNLKNSYFLLDVDTTEELDDFELLSETRRARGAIPWNASPQAILTQVEVALRQVKALAPYLAPELVERIVAQAGKRQVTSQYRPTSVLFCNFTGPEALLDLWGESGAQRVTGLLDAYFTAMQGVIARYGGIISRIDPYSKGSKLLALFGAPVAHEDDPQRAVSAALAMNAELEVLEEQWRKKYARHLPEEWNSPLIQHRVGVTTGITFAGLVGSSTRREYTVMGDDVNLSARLMSAAEMGRVLISKTVYDAVEDYFVFTPRPAIKVKGKSKPIPIYQVEGPQEDTLANRAHSRERLVGRSAELAFAGQSLEQACNGIGGILVIQGPAGIGKSHLADELMLLAIRRGARAVFNLCRSYNVETPFTCWSQLLRSLAGITSIDYSPRVRTEKFRRMMTCLHLPDENWPPLAALMGLRRSDLDEGEKAVAHKAGARKNRTHEKSATVLSTVHEKSAARSTEEEIEAVLSTAGEGDLRELVQAGGRLRRRGSSLDVLDQLDRGQASDMGQSWQQMPEKLSRRERDELENAVLALLHKLSASAPLVIFLEDAHWIDESSLELLRFLDDHFKSSHNSGHNSAHRLPVLFLLARRSGGYARGSASPVGKLGVELNLEPFDQAGASALVAHLLVSDLAQVIYEQSGGNPLYVEEITRWFRRTYNINADELRNVLQTSDFLQKLVLSGLEGLPEAQREVARVATVIGEVFFTGEVQALLPVMDPVSLSNHLVALARTRLIRLMEPGADARYAFQQTLVRDILYNSLPHEQRREIHARLAAYLSGPVSARRMTQARIAAALESSPTNPVQEAEIIAYHYEQAELWFQAARQLFDAAEKARQQRLFEKSSTCYSRALGNLNRLSSVGAPEEAASLRRQIDTGYGDISMLTGDYLSAAASYESALYGLPESVAPEERLDLIRKLAMALPTQGRAADALQWLRQAAPHPHDAGSPGLAAVMAWLLWRSGKSEAKKWVNRAQELLTVGGLLGSAAIHASVEALLTDLSGECRLAVVDYIELELPDGAGLALVRLGDQELALGNLDEAMVDYERAARVWGQSLDSPTVESTVGQNGKPGGALPLALFRQAEIHFRRDDWQTAQQTLERALEGIERSAASFQVSGRSAIQRALKLVAATPARKARTTPTNTTRQAARWPACDWQAFDDEFRITLLFHA